MVESKKKVDVIKLNSVLRKNTLPEGGVFFCEKVLTLYGQSIMMIVRAKKEGDAMTPIKKGTKLTDNPRNVRLEIRLTKEENRMLEECAEKMKSTKTDIIKRGIYLVSKEINE